MKVWDDEQLLAEGFGGIMGVGQGSSRLPRLVRIEHAPADAVAHIAIVGKGITFDTGGISLKPASNMEDMISDMGGSAAVVAAISAAARLELGVRVEAWVPLAENMPSGTASHPGDVITHYGGITSEILNTDAEAYEGSGTGNLGGVTAQDTPWHGRPYSAAITVGPRACVWLRHEK